VRVCDRQPPDALVTCAPPRKGPLHRSRGEARAALPTGEERLHGRRHRRRLSEHHRLPRKSEPMVHDSALTLSTKRAPIGSTAVSCTTRHRKETSRPTPPILPRHQTQRVPLGRVPSTACESAQARVGTITDQQRRQPGLSPVARPADHHAPLPLSSNGPASDPAAFTRHCSINPGLWALHLLNDSPGIQPARQYAEARQAKEEARMGIVTSTKRESRGMSSPHHINHGRPMMAAIGSLPAGSCGVLRRGASAVERSSLWRSPPGRANGGVSSYARHDQDVQMKV
jgi:hypothetical protein